MTMTFVKVNICQYIIINKKQHHLSTSNTISQPLRRKNRMSNISDIAKRAGVSSSTVSYVLSGKRPISEEVKQRVYQATQDLGYQPNSLARALVTKRTRIIALLYPSWNASPQMEFVTSIATIATLQGYALLLWTSTS